MYKSGKNVESNPGTLFRSYSEIDLFALKKIHESIKNGQKIPQTDVQAYLSIYEGHTVFSIFANHIEVFDHILAHLKELEFHDEEDLNGHKVENNVSRKLYRILNRPTTQFYNKDWKRNSNGPHRRKKSCLSVCKKWLQKTEEETEDKSSVKNFSSVPKRSLYFQS